MTANPSKFQSLIVSKNDNHIKEFQINNDFKINISNEVTLLGIQIDEQLKFDSHIDKICKKLLCSSTLLNDYLDSWVVKRNK